jgi:hypothetical protein
VVEFEPEPVTTTGFEAATHRGNRRRYAVSRSQESFRVNDESAVGGSDSSGAVPSRHVGRTVQRAAEALRDRARLATVAPMRRSARRRPRSSAETKSPATSTSGVTATPNLTPTKRVRPHVATMGCAAPARNRRTSPSKVG